VNSNKNLPFKQQILAITCDNAENNATMLRELQWMLFDFPGPANRARCFTHILNLVMKSIMRQFDVPKAKKNNIDEVTKELFKLAGEIEEEEDAEIRENGADGDDEDGPDNFEGWIDERSTMSEEALKELDKSLQPVRFLLTKVS
jgi:hypothetical protein